MTTQLAVAIAAASGCTGAFAKVFFVYLVQDIHYLQALADQPYLPLHVRHGVLHPPHLPLQGHGYGPVVPLPGFVLQPQLLVAVVLSLRVVGQHGPAAHVAWPAPVFTVAFVIVQVPAQELHSAALVRTRDELVHARHAVAVLLGEAEGFLAAADLIFTLSGGKQRVGNVLVKQKFLSKTTTHFDLHATDGFAQLEHGEDEARVDMFPAAGTGFLSALEKYQ